MPTEGGGGGGGGGGDNKGKFGWGYADQTFRPLDPYHEVRLLIATLFNPLNPKSDQHQISPCNRNALLNRVVMRIKDMITQDVFVWYFIRLSPLLL